MIQSKTLYLVRHGIATHSAHGYGKRKLTAPLLPEAEPVIQRLARSLIGVTNSCNVSSEIIRCRQTSAIITKETGKQFIYDSRLNEDYHETVGAIKARVTSFLNDIDKVSEDTIIICTHGIIIAAIKNLVINNSFVTSQRLDYPQPGELLIIKRGAVEEINFN